jgi:tetraacyldisaccharide 4'-kinase
VGKAAFIGRQKKGPRLSRHTFRSPLLAPFSAVYAALLAAKNFGYNKGQVRAEKLTWPVISVGSLSAGGAGKTPFTLLLAQTLLRHGWQPDVLSRGYGRSSNNCVQVQPDGDVTMFGDEPLLLAQQGLPVFVAPRRYRAGLLAEQTLSPAPHRVHILDDGFQHRRLARSLDLVLLTAEDWRDTLLPAGNLREPRSSLMRADAIALRSDEAAEIEGPMRDWLKKNSVKPQIFLIRRKLALMQPPLRPFAFCAIARPQDFFAQLRSTRCELAGVSALRDHAPYTLQTVEKIAEAARRADADGFITTEKDAVKLTQSLRTVLENVGAVTVASLTTEFCNEEIVMQWLLAKIAAHNEAAS